VHPEILNLLSVGFRFFTITAKPWPPWTSFTVPTVTFNLLYRFFIISHDRRRILHFNITRHPASSWIVQQLREAFPYQSAPKFLLFDHDAKYGLEVPAAIRSMTIACVRTSIGSPWQNGVAERWVGSCRRDLLDHIIALNERPLKRFLADYVRYSHGLAKATTQRQSSFSSSGSRRFSRPARGPAPPLRSGRVRQYLRKRSPRLSDLESGELAPE